MKDQNDFFDDTIDDETDLGEPLLADEFEDSDEEDEEDDEEEPLDLRTAVLTKNGMVALLSLRTTATGGRVVRVDPRQSLPTAQTYEDAESAAAWFRRSLATSGRNGWTVIYEGEPLVG